MPDSPGQSTAIPFRATGIAIYLENNGTSETVQKIAEGIFNPLFVISQSRINARNTHCIRSICSIQHPRHTIDITLIVF